MKKYQTEQMADFVRSPKIIDMINDFENQLVINLIPLLPAKKNSQPGSPLTNRILFTLL